MRLQIAKETYATQREAALVSRLLWGLAGVNLAIAAVAATLAGLRFAHSQEFLLQFAGYFGLMVALRQYSRFRGLSDTRFLLGVDIAPTFAAISLAQVVIQYSAATLPAPEITRAIERIDHVFGFYWFDYAHFVGGIALLRETFRFCYFNWLTGMILALVALAFVREYRAIGEFAIAFVLVCLTIIAIFGCVDVRALASVAAFTQPGYHVPSSAGPAYLHALEALRAGAARTLDFQDISPLISFPSLHGATALLLAAATRGLGAWRYPFFAFNVGVLVSTLNEGGHYLTDVIAGGALACAALAASSAIYRALPRPTTQPAHASPVGAVATS